MHNVSQQSTFGYNWMQFLRLTKTANNLYITVKKKKATAIETLQEGLNCLLLSQTTITTPLLMSKCIMSPTIPQSGK